MDANPLARFSWLAVAPLFIDAPQVERFYDAIANPTYVEGASTVSVSNTGKMCYGGEVGGKGTLSFAGDLLQLFGLGKADAEVSGKMLRGRRTASRTANKLNGGQYDPSCGRWCG